MNRKAALGGGALLAVVLMGGAYLLGKAAVGDPPDVGGKSPTPTGTSTPTGTPTTIETGAPVPDGFVRIRDLEETFSMGVPKDWGIYETEQKQVKLIASPNDRDYVQVRVIEGGAATEADLIEAKNAAAGALKKQGVTQIAKPEWFNIGGLPSVFFFYEFDDEPSGKTGVHAHYFAFSETHTYVIIFQALPSKGFGELAGTFDQMVESFRPIVADDAGPTPSATPSPEG